MTAYLALNTSIFINNIDSVIRASIGTDATLPLTKVNLNIGACLLAMFDVAALEHETLGCIATDIVVWISLIVVIGVLSIRFICAIFFQWFISWQLGKLRKKNLEGNSAALQRTSETREQALRRTMPRRAAMGRSARRRRTETMTAPIISSDQPRTSFDKSTQPSPHNEVEGEDLIGRRVTHTLNIGKMRQSMIAINPYESEFGEELYTILLVTFFSEDVQGLRGTIASLATTTFGDDKKLLFIVADGLIKGAGNEMTTSDIVLSLLELDPLWKDPMPQEYLAIGSGKNRENRAKVYVGWYEPEGTGRLIPAVMHYLLGVTPDHFEVVLMVDADTKVAPDALSRMVACMSRDPKIMGLCGETRIANKRQSWVTRIQVFEYYISHHLAKAFESVFGGVTCLPGCFCMYRIKVPSEHSRWIPIICSPTITSVYSQCEVTTLHQKNLLLLGEDRFLTTLMLRTFPRRSPIFVPKAFCKTVVPDTLQELLSQRRRWINSTIHNLLELVLVNESMQFVIMLELVGTIHARIRFPESNHPVPQLMLLLCILLAPSLLVAMSTLRLAYVYWLAIYLIALPVWNVLLPLYAFWHFDDFSWGQTPPRMAMEVTDEWRSM
ncbi:putative chitin synthase division II class IV [Cladochytrium replicatum]|nr:putative chitin synthase division II class IV [Cladochytrium replicatum]